MKKAFLMIAISFLFITGIDINIWQRIFEANEMWQFAATLGNIKPGTYHYGLSVAILGIWAVGITALYNNWKQISIYTLGMLVGLSTGWIDVLYYWLDGRAIPAELPWLNYPNLILKPVTAENLVLSAIAGILITFLIPVIWASTRTEGNSNG